MRFNLDSAIPRTSQDQPLQLFTSFTIPHGNVKAGSSGSGSHTPIDEQFESTSGHTPHRNIKGLFTLVRFLSGSNPASIQHQRVNQI